MAGETFERTSNPDVVRRPQGYIPPRKPRAFIPQEPMKKDVTGQMVTAMNFAKASEYGDPIVCLPWGPVALSTVPAVETLRDKLADFCDTDYLICVGDPTVLAMAAMVAAERNHGRVNLLKWDKRAGIYFVCQVRL